MVASALVFQLAACGTILYPERKGQVSGKIDVGVAVLDGIGHAENGFRATVHDGEHDGLPFSPQLVGALGEGTRVHSQVLE